MSVSHFSVQCVDPEKCFKFGRVRSVINNLATVLRVAVRWQAYARECKCDKDDELLRVSLQKRSTRAINNSIKVLKHTVKKGNYSCQNVAMFVHSHGH